MPVNRPGPFVDNPFSLVTVELLPSDLALKCSPFPCLRRASCPLPFSPPLSSPLSAVIGHEFCWENHLALRTYHRSAVSSPRRSGKGCKGRNFRRRFRHGTEQHGRFYSPAARVVKVPCRMMLDLMIEELAFPKAKYDCHRDIRGRITAVVTFYVSARVPGNLLRPIKIGGAEATDSETAEESAAKEGIRFVESWENVEVEDLHYSKLKYKKETRHDLIKKLEYIEHDRESLLRGLSLAASRMTAFSNQMYNIACNNRSLGQGVQAEAINEPIDLFEGVAADLGHAGQCLKSDITKVAKFLKKQKAAGLF